MTTYFPFVPSATTPFQFQPVLDGAPYQASVPSLLFGNRYYLNLLAADGTLIWFGAISGSKPRISLQSLSWANGIVTATTTQPHGYKVASSVTLTVQGCTPSGYNGQFSVMSTGAQSLSWQLAANPGVATVLGSIGQDINLISGVPNQNGVAFQSSIVFRTGTQQFEVNP